MFEFLKLAIFILISTGFGFILLSQLAKIKSIILLIPLSISFGLASYIFFLHSLSFLSSPSRASLLSILIQLVISTLVIILKRKNLHKVELKIKTKEITTILLVASVICILTFLSIYRYGTYDREVHIPMALTIFHNNAYPPRDPFRPDYIFLYHYGGDLLSGAINHISGFEISTSYELASALLSSTTFLSYFALAWLLTTSFKISLTCAFCTYFGGGLMWLDAILRYLTKNFPSGINNWSFLETFLNLGIHGSIINPPSSLAFSSTSSFGNPLLIFSLIVFWKMLEENRLKNIYTLATLLMISLFTLYLTADWLYITFWVAALSFLIFLWLKKQKIHFAPVLILLSLSLILVKTLGNPLFLQDLTQNLGRTNILDIGIKEKLFSVVSWGRLTHVMNYQTVNCFSWDFLCEFGLSLILLPIAIIYLVKTKKTFAILLFLTALTTMPVPVLIDFKLSPVELVRFFAFGNTMLILLITVGISYLFKIFFNNGFLLAVYILVLCTSPICQLFSGIIFTPRVYMNKPLVQRINYDLKKARTLGELKLLFEEYNKFFLNSKNFVINNYEEEIDFLRHHGNPGDAVISNLFEIPSYAGLYSYLPSRKFIYWDQLYSPFSTIFQTVFRTLDPYLLKELNIKWLLITEDFEKQLPKEIQDKLNSSESFKLLYKSKISANGGKDITNKTPSKIYEIKKIDSLLTRKTAWLLLNNQGQLAEIASLNLNKITLFPSKNDTLLYLRDLYNLKPELKRQLITAQPITISDLEKEIKENNLNIAIEKEF